MKELSSWLADGSAGWDAGTPVPPAMTQLLLIEDDDRIRRIVETGLRRRGFAVSCAADGAAGVRALRMAGVELVLLDLVLPDVDGFALLTAIRAARPRLPVIAVTALDDVRSKVNGFDGGADDYVTKPFSLDELAARVRANLRRREDGTLLESGPLRLDLATNRASLGEQSVPLSAREASLLAVLLRRGGEVLSRAELLRLVWEIDFDPGSNVVDVYVAALRRKLGATVIETVRNRGYRLAVARLRERTAVG
jgi:two-component system, OmpR family, copper resistance phosphate regulon response regulator CusR